MVRVRFAPSPTGPLHIGGVRTCLYNYLFAKKQNGKLLLRIEDTDQTRFVPGAEEYIIEAFDWLGIQFDEGVHVGGPHAPYKQSERMELYREFADLLIRRGWAYYAFDTPQELEQRRKEAEAQKSTFQYDTQTRGSLCNSLTLSPEEVEERLKGDYVIRFKHPENQDITVNDLIRGEVVINTRILDDKVLFKSDGLPTYHLANIVDDHLMEITHVIRGEEWLPSAPLHVMLYRAFEWEAPQFAHLPLLLKPDGNGKLSKRDGDRLGFPVFPLEWKDPVTQEISSGYRESGYLPEAVINMLALLGWNPGNDQEVMSMEELIEQFSLDKVSKSGAKFDLDKARWFNHHYIQLCEEEQLASPLFLILKEKEIEASEEQVLKVISLVKERVYFMTEWWEQVHYFFVAPTEYNPDVIKKRWKENTAEHLQAIRQLLLTATSSEKEHLHTLVTQYIQDQQLNMGQIMNCLRLALVGDTKGVDLFEIVEFIGVEETVRRIEKAILEIAK
ncbi:MAG TPA: glutamate--tRNA ligase [Bacteroidales bacterium]|nr:glutamate--tRNA ligase [Bacteroidales bacterium]HPZ04126.1 glutamate--tRNA ligase [Bacteroidales bacterium]HQB75208.1 glutamate--tRNA ligase [Bacteroidales bacterium]